MKKVLSVYVIAYLALLACVLGLLYAYPKLELHLMLNSCHTSFLDSFFKYYSKLAEWPLYILALLPLFWKRKEITLFYALCEVSGSVIIYVVKHIVRAPRPISVFAHHPDMALPVVEGVRLHHTNSFPSGHASAFFVFFTCCALILAYQYKLSAEKDGRNTWFTYSLLMLLMLAFAAVGGYSRIYLSQHFLADVCMGSVIGVAIPFLIYCAGGKKMLNSKKG